MRRSILSLLALIAALFPWKNIAMALSCTDPIANWGNEALVRQLLEEASLVFVGRMVELEHAPCRNGFVYYSVHVEEILKGHLEPAAGPDGTILIAHQVWPGCNASGRHDLRPVDTMPLLYVAGSPSDAKWAKVDAIDRASASAVLGACSFGHRLDVPLQKDAQAVRDRLLDELRLHRN